MEETNWNPNIPYLSPPTKEAYWELYWLADKAKKGKQDSLTDETLSLTSRYLGSLSHTETIMECLTPAGYDMVLSKLIDAEDVCDREDCRESISTAIDRLLSQEVVENVREMRRLNNQTRKKAG